MEKKKKSKLQIVFEIFIFSPPCDLLAAESLSISKSVVSIGMLGYPVMELLSYGNTRQHGFFYGHGQFTSTQVVKFPSDLISLELGNVYEPPC